MAKFGTIIGVGGAGNLPTTNELPVDMHRKTMERLTDLTPLTSILTRLGEDKAHNFRIDWQEEKDIADIVTIATTESSVGTTIVVADHGTSLVDDTLLYNPRTFDLRRVNGGNSSSNSITVAIDQGGTTSAIWKSGDPIHVLPPAVPENDQDVYRIASAQAANIYNYEQLIRMQFSITRIMDKQTTEFGGPGEKRKSLKRQKYREFRRKWEKLLYFGGRSTSGSAPADLRMAGGLVHYLRNGTLYKDFDGIFTESGFDNLLLSFREENPDVHNIAGLFPLAVIQKINYWGKDKIRISPNTKKYGLDLKSYQMGGLNVDLIEAPLMKDSITRGWGFLLDFERMRLKNLDSPMFFPDALNVGQSERIYDMYRVVTSMLVGNESGHVMFVGADL